jgi:hypothetical protein
VGCGPLVACWPKKRASSGPPAQPAQALIARASPMVTMSDMAAEPTHGGVEIATFSSDKTA